MESMSNLMTVFTLLNIEIHSKLNFDKHISQLCNERADQLFLLTRLSNFHGFEEKKVLINSFIYANFSYCPQV